MDTQTPPEERLSVRAMASERYAIMARRLRNHVIWTRVDMRAALGSRDVARLYRLLQRYGMSQRVIAAMTGQSQSEISEILSGRRVVSYDVLARIADGLAIPRGRMGLAFDDDTAAFLAWSAGEDLPASTQAATESAPLWGIFGGGEE